MVVLLYDDSYDDNYDFIAHENSVGGRSLGIDVLGHFLKPQSIKFSMFINIYRV